MFMKNNIWEDSKKYILVTNRMMNICNMLKRYTRSGLEQVLIYQILDIRRNIKKETVTDRDKLPNQRQLAHSITVQGSIDSNNKPLNETPKPSIRKSLYKHVHSKVYSNVNPQKSMTELP